MSLTQFGFSSFSGDYYARGLGQVLRQYRLPDLDSALAQDPSSYEKIRRDPVVSFAFRYRKLLARGSDWYLDPAGTDDKDRDLAKILEDLLKEIQYFDAGRYNLMEAIPTGSRWARIVPEMKKMRVGELPPLEWWCCTELRDVDKRRFRQLPIDKPSTAHEVTYPGPATATPGAEPVTNPETVVVREWIWQIFRPLQQRWEEIEREEYVRHVHESREEDLQYGSGLVSELYTYWYAKEVVLQHGLQYLERWSMGLLIASVDTLRDGQASQPPSSQRMADWLTTLNNMRSRNAVVHDSRDKIDLKDAPPTGWKAALEAIEYLDGVLRVAILGASLPTSWQVEGGSYALAEVQERTTEVLNKYDHAVLEDTIRRDLLGWLVRKNKTTLDRLGLGDCTLPYFRLRSTHADNHAEWADIIIKARQAGLEIREDEAYTRLGFSIPAKGDKILASLAQQESLNQGGDPDAREGSGVEGDDQSDQARDVADRIVDTQQAGQRNRLRPANKPGAGKPAREKAIDKSTQGFATGTPGRPFSAGTLDRARAYAAGLAG